MRRRSFDSCVVDQDFHIYLRPNTPDNPEVGGSYSVECDIVGPVRIGTPEWISPEGQIIRGLGIGKWINHK